MDKVIIATNGNRFVNAMFKDVKKNPSYIDWDNVCYLRNRLEYFLFRIHTSKKINNIIRLPYQDYWIKNKNYAKRYPFRADIVYHIIFFNTSFDFFPLADLKELQKHNNIKMSVVLIDSCEKKDTMKFQEYFKYLDFKNIYTFDKGDSLRYGFKFTHQMYSKLPVTNKKQMRQSDIYFIGYNKGRATKICELYRFLTAKNVICDFTINGSVDEISEVDCDGVFTNRYASYQDVINEIQGANCILEMLQDGQEGTTLRYYEAVCYNKKLLTNNESIKEYEFYNPEYMKIYTDLNEIDIGWLKQKNKVDYQYKGEFSPLKLIEHITEKSLGVRKC
ncbi:MAG: hypothetical protein ACI4JC_06195 [Faecalibacterium sp.]